MNGSDLDARVAEYVLGTLDIEERDDLERAAASDPGIRAAIDAWEVRLAGLETDTSAITPPEELWQRVERRIEALEPEGLTARTIRANQGEWVLRSPGVHKKVLFTDREARTESYFLRLDPGATIKTHKHSQIEECLVVEGEIDHGELHLEAGDYQVVAPGQVHSVVHSNNGAVLYIRGEIRNAA